MIVVLTFVKLGICIVVRYKVYGNLVRLAKANRYSGSVIEG
jgi:hypothetical protein